jgi:undecaprenyl diphosphate synthase
MTENVPKHVAVIMDGNGRWALARGKKRLAGHRAGVDALERMLGWCRDAGVKILTVYAFSTENWKRPAEEVSGLMKLFSTFIRLKTRKLMREGVRFRVIGRRGDLPPALAASIARVEEKTASFEQQLVLAVSYGGRAEIVDAARRLVAEAAAGQIRPEDVDEALVGNRLYAPDLSDPDLIIRTSGEQRISNFLLWECAYSEFFFTDVLWPDFSREDFDAALASYAARDRRKGGHA